MDDLFPATLQVVDSSKTEINKAILDLLAKINKVGSLVGSSGFGSQISAGKNVRTQIRLSGASGLFSAAAGAIDTPEGPGPSTTIWYFLYSGDEKNGNLTAWSSLANAANEWNSVLSTQAGNAVWSTWTQSSPMPVASVVAGMLFETLGDGTKFTPFIEDSRITTGTVDRTETVLALGVGQTALINWSCGVTGGSSRNITFALPAGGTYLVNVTEGNASNLTLSAFPAASLMTGTAIAGGTTKILTGIASGGALCLAGFVKRIS